MKKLNLLILLSCTLISCAGPKIYSMKACDPNKKIEIENIIKITEGRVLKTDTLLINDTTKCYKIFYLMK